MRLAEAIKLIRQLWTEERVDFEGEWYRTEKATIYDRPDEPVPIYVAASGPLAAKLAGRAGDGLIVTTGKDPELYDKLVAAAAEGAEKAGRDPDADRPHDRGQGLLRPRRRLGARTRAGRGRRWP